ncbi:MAG: hypothetical protein U0797_26270 [Gemmataceae bacterium]
MTKAPRQTFYITVVDAAGAGDAPAVIRLKAVLKRLLRTWSFRCTGVAELPPGQPAPPAQPDQ